MSVLDSAHNCSKGVAAYARTIGQCYLCALGLHTIVRQIEPLQTVALCSTVHQYRSSRVHAVPPYGMAVPHIA
eukprot:271265-Rhodomonas_salina.1